jgi:hypothetical protein
MPSLRRLPARRSTQPSARLVLLVLTFVFVAAVAAFVCVEPPASSACPVVLPKPLRVLYRESTLVAVGRVVGSVAVETGEGSTPMKTSLQLSSLLKGESKERVVHLYHYAWGEADESSPKVLAKDDVLLVFLMPGEDGDGYVPADYERGVRKLPPDDLKVYVSRLEELASIMRSKKPDAAALTEWLVRCAEEPATRWEGAYELAPETMLFEEPKKSGAGAGEGGAADTGRIVEAARTDGQQTKPDADAAESAAAITTVDAARSNVVSESGGRVEPGEKIHPLAKAKAEEEMDFTALLTPAHKERLTLALLSAEELEAGEQMLLRLVGNWKDARLVPFSLKHLARMADNPPYHAEDLMRIVAYTHGDPTLIKFATDYREDASYEDVYEDAEYDADEDREATAEERAALKKEFAEMRAAALEARARRSGKLRHFLALADQPQTP